MPSALLVIDMQNAVVEGIDSAAATIAAIGRLVDGARAAGAPVVWVQHDDPDEVPAGTPGWEIAPGLTPHPDELRVAKQHRSSFAGTGLADALRARGVDHVVLTGAQSAFCVDMAGKHALAEGFDLTLVSDGHCNGTQDTAAGDLSDAQVRALINRTWSTLRHPGRQVAVVPSSGVAW